MQYVKSICVKYAVMQKLDWPYWYAVKYAVMQKQSSQIYNYAESPWWASLVGKIYQPNFL